MNRIFHYHDFSIKEEKRKERAPFNNNNKEFFFAPETHTIKTLGLVPKTPRKNFITFQERFLNLGDEIFLLDEFFTNELKKIKELSSCFDNKKFLIYTQTVKDLRKKC